MARPGPTSPLTLCEDLTRHSSELVGQRVQELIQLLRQLCASIVARLSRALVSLESSTSGELQIRPLASRGQEGAGGPYIWLVVWLTVVGCHLRESSRSVGAHKFSSISSLAYRFKYFDFHVTMDRRVKGRAYDTEVANAAQVWVRLLTLRCQRATAPVRASAKPSQGIPGTRGQRYSRGEGPASSHLDFGTSGLPLLTRSPSATSNSTIFQCTGDRLVA